MKKIIKKYRNATLLIAMFIFSLHINAVFEGRSEQLKEYTEIRNRVELAPFGSEQKAAGTINPGGTTPPPNDMELGRSPVSDTPWIILILGLGYGVYVLNRKKFLVE